MFTKHLPHPRHALLACTCAASSVAILAFSGCSTTTTTASDAQPQGSSAAAALKVVATTGYLGDLVKNVAPDAQLTVLVKPGGDPHEYQAGTQDLMAMQAADVVLSNGLGLESSLHTHLESLGAKHVAVAGKLPPNQLLPWKAEKHEDEHGHDDHATTGKKAEDNKAKDDHAHGDHDPHVWNNPTLWSQAATIVAETLGKARSDKAAQFTSNATAYAGKIAAVHSKAKAQLASLPKDRRTVVTGHDAFNYLGQAYGLTFRASDVISPEAQITPAEINELATLIAAKKIPTIFADNVKNPQAITSIQQAVTSKGFTVKVSTTQLYADSLGDTAPVDTYLGVLKHNLDTIAQGLGGK